MTDDIRTMEHEVVDQCHRSFRVWRRPHSAIVCGVLRHPGQELRDFWAPGVPDASLLNLWRVFNKFKRGAAQAVRCANDSDVIEYDRFPENAQVLDETLDMFRWALTYGRLAAGFIAWTRKAMHADLTQTDKCPSVRERSPQGRKKYPRTA